MQLIGCVGENNSTVTLRASENAATLTYPFLLRATTQTIRLYAYVYVFDNAGAKVKSAITSIIVRADISDPRYFVWTNMNAALKAGNKTAALEFLTPTAQMNYADIFDALLPNMAAIISSYSPIVNVSLTPDTAEYLVGRDISGTRVAFVLRFLKMGKDLWKLDGP